MRITNDCTPVELILTLCSPNSVTPEDTAWFFGGKERSSHDWLVQEWTDKVQLVLEFFSRYRHDVTELQGLRDDGVDVLMQMSEDDCTNYRVGFQLKSNREAHDNSKRKEQDPESTLTRTMKRQYGESFRKNLNEWWFIQCFDLAKYANLVRTNYAELPPDTIRGVTIRQIGPRGAMAFLSRSDEEIAAICLLYLSDDDPVLQAAKKEMEGLSPFEWAIVDTWLWDGLEPGLEELVPVSDAKLMDIGSTFDDDVEDGSVEPEAIEDVIHGLERDRFLVHHDGFYRVSPNAFPALCALYFDAKVRNEFSHASTIQFVRHLLHSKKIHPEDEFAS